MKTCKKCLISLEEDRFAGNRPTCRKCSNKRAYESRIRRLISNEMKIESRITLWIERVKSKGNKVNREGLSKEFLRKAAMEGLKRFPYMIFSYRKEEVLKRTTGGHPFSASVDRKNPKLGYVESNIEIIPLWLNNAKYNCKMEDLIPLLKHFVENYDIFMELVKKSSTT